MKRKILWRVLLVAGLCATGSWAAAQEPWTLREVYLSVLGANEQILIAREDVSQAGSEQRKALSGMLPTLETDFNYTRRPDAVLTTGGNVSRPEEEHDLEIRIRQPLYSGGRAMAAYRMAKDGIQERSEALDATSDDLLLQAATAYYEVLKAEENRSIARVEVERLERHLRAAQLRLDVGEVTKTVVLRAQAELSRARADLVLAETSLKTARDQLILLAKLPPDFELARPPAPFLPRGRETELIDEARRQRSDLAASHLREQIAVTGVRLAKGYFLPTISIEGTYRRQEQDPENQFIFAKIDKRATVSLNLPLFEGGLRLAELREARSKARQAELEHALLEDQIAVEVRTALRDLRAVTSVLANRTDQVSFAQENFTLVEKQFGFGLATNIDVLDANSILNDAQRELSNRQYDRDLAILKLQKSVGIYADHVGIRGIGD